MANNIPNTQDKITCDEKLKFKADPIHAQVAELNSKLDPEIFNDLISNRIAQAKFSVSTGSTTNPQYDIHCKLFSGEEAIEALAGATHAEKPQGVTSEMLQKVWQIEPKTAKMQIQLCHETLEQITGCYAIKGSTHSFTLTHSLSLKRCTALVGSPACSYLCQTKGMFLSSL